MRRCMHDCCMHGAWRLGAGCCWLAAAGVDAALGAARWWPQVSEIKPEWLVEVAPHYYSKKDIADDAKKLPKGKGRSAPTA